MILAQIMIEAVRSSEGLSFGAALWQYGIATFDAQSPPCPRASALSASSGQPRWSVLSLGCIRS
jgi:hypothetical protein